MIASTAGAASLGRLVVLSAIGEPLRAEIDLSVSPEELDTVSPRLASVDDYAAAGLSYNPALNGARLAIQYRHNGRRVVDLVTTRPVNEPSLPILLELEVRGGRISRAYQVLLGPQPEVPARAAPPAALAPVSNVAVAATPPALQTPPVVSAPVAKTRAVARPVAESAAKTLPAADRAAFDRELQRLDTQIKDSGKVLNDMLARVAVMEREVAQLQKAFAALPAAAPKPAAEPAVTGKPAAEKPVAEKPAAQPAVEKPVVAAAPASSIAATAPLTVDPIQPPVAAAPPPAAPVIKEVQSLPAAKVEAAPRKPHKSDYLLNEALLVLAGGVLVLFMGLGYVMFGRRRASKAAEAETDAQNAG